MSIKKTTTSSTTTRKKKSVTAAQENPKIFRCMKCGTETATPLGRFYKSPYSDLWDDNDRYFPVCIDCLGEKFDMYIKRFGVRNAYIIMCHYLDIPFSESTFEAVNQNNSSLTVGNYSRLINTRQFQAQTFVNTLVSGELNKTRTDIREAREVKWNKSDLRNKQYVISQLGYDPYDDEIYSEVDRKFLFNALEGYLTNDVLEDPHRRQSAINLMQTILQRDKIDRLLNEQLMSNSTTDLKLLTESKARLDNLINSIANENGFTMKGAVKGSGGGNAITAMMRKMQEDNFEECKVNSIDAKLEGAYRNIADISNSCIMAQLNFQQDEFAAMVAQQREMITAYERNQISLQEENRKLRVIAKGLSVGTDIELPPPARLVSPKNLEDED